MDEDFIPEPGHLLKFVRKLREVFDVCDEDADGFIRLEHLLQLGSQFGQAEQVGVIDVCHRLCLFIYVKFYLICQLDKIGPQYFLQHNKRFYDI